MTYRKIIFLLFATTLTLFSNTLFAALAKTIFENKLSVHAAALFLQPKSNNLKYAVFVSGNQPLSQSWHNQTIEPGYSPGFELGIKYGLPQSFYNAGIDWMYLNTNDSSEKQASQSTVLSTVQFVAPPYDVGPAVFGIKRADSNVNYNFNSVLLNVGRLFTFSCLQINVFGGIDILRIHQTLTTTFSNYAGSPPIPTQAYGLPRDPNFYFETKNTSKYLGVGPDLGINFQYTGNNGLGLVGQFLGTLTAGSMRAQDDFTSASTQLMLQGMTTSRQSITTPNTVEVVPGLDSKLGLFFNHARENYYDIAIELGYRFAYYMNAISQVTPQTLVQAGPNVFIPEFATGTMAINSTQASYSPFSMQGPYINLTINLV